MEDTTKIETKATSVRLPLDVIETLQRWHEETGQSVAGCITTCVRVALEDEKRITNVATGVFQEGDEIQNAGMSVIQVRTPTSRDELADAITLLMRETKGRIGDRDQISALGVARARVYKTTPEYQSAQVIRDQAGVVGVYSDEKALAKKLSEGGGAGDTGSVREKGDKSR